MIKTKRISRKKLIITAALAAVLVGGLAFYFLQVRKPSVTTTPSTTAEEDAAQVEQGVSAKNPNSVQASQNDKDSGTSQNTQDVMTPRGSFVSNDKVNMNSTIESICITNANINCDISFKKDGITKSVGKKSTNSSGTASWIWTPNSIGLSPGSWDIVATAEYNGKTAQQTYIVKLEVSP